MMSTSSLRPLLTSFTVIRKTMFSPTTFRRAVFRTPARCMAGAAIPKPAAGGGGNAGQSSRRNPFDRNLQWLTRVAPVGLGLVAAQSYFGDGEDIFEHKFKTRADPTDLADFYGTEEFMEVFCIFPFVVQLMMRGAEFDDEGNIHAFGLSGRGGLHISVDFDEKEVDTTGDGEPDTLAWFNKREHFYEAAPSFLGGFTIWDLTQNFGYHRLDDGTCEVYHHGEKFQGFFPIRLIFQLHARYVIWATEKYVNSTNFGAADRENELEEQRHNIPHHVFMEFIESLTASLEQAQKRNAGDEKKHEEIEVTIKRLKTVLSKAIEDNEAGAATPPRLRTLTSHRTGRISRVHLEVDDKETKDAIRTAMQQIGSAPNGHSKHIPVSNMHRLTRRTTRLNNDRKASNPPATSDRAGFDRNDEE